MEYIDLGLSVKWANCNVGASTPEEYGDYFNYIDAIQLKDTKIPTYEQWRELQDNCDCKLNKKSNKIRLPFHKIININNILYIIKIIIINSLIDLPVC